MTSFDDDTPFGRHLTTAFAKLDEVAARCPGRAEMNLDVTGSGMLHLEVSPELAERVVQWLECQGLELTDEQRAFIRTLYGADT